jgi:hypothetical protein
MGAVRLVRGGVCSARAMGLASYQSNKRIVVYEIAYSSHFDVEVGRPYLSYGRHFADCPPFEREPARERNEWEKAVA